MTSSTSTLLPAVAQVALIGVGATAVMDLWLWGLKRMHVPTLDLALMGRWVGHVAHGRWAHAAMARAEPIAAERALGWLTHYAVGVVFAGVLVALVGMAWVARPSLVPALGVGVGTVLAPWLVMQPAMGAGWAASRTATPWRNRLRSLAGHAVFGLGLYVSAVALGLLMPA